MTYAYTGELLLPVTVTPAAGGTLASRRTPNGWSAGTSASPRKPTSSSTCLPARPALRAGAAVRRR